MIDTSKRWQVIQGDCLEVLRELPDGCVDAVVTDPPYGIDYQSAWRIDRASWKPKIKNDTQPFVWFLRDAVRAMSASGCMICLCRWDVQEAFRAAMTWAGCAPNSQLVWDRVGHGMGDLRGAPAPQHDVAWFARGPEYQHHGKRPKSVVRHKRLSGAALTHPNEKPVDLMAQWVEEYAPPGGLVLDPFAGSGTTGVACMDTGRRFIGIELDAGYCDIARERIAKAEAKAEQEAA